MTEVNGSRAAGQPPADDSGRGRLFTRAFVTLTIAELAYFTAAGLMLPVTPLFAAGPLGASELLVGLTVGAFSVTALILRPFAGRISDRHGRRPLLVVGALLFALVTAGHVLAGDLAVLIVLRLLLGAAEALFFVAGFAAVADLAPAGRTGEALSFNSLALYLGIAIGPALGESLLASGGFEVAWLGGAALALTAAALAATMPETASPERALAPPGPIICRMAVGPSVALFTGIAGMSGFLWFVALHAQNLGMSGTGGVLFAFGGTVIATRVVFARLPDRLPPFRLGAAALVLIAVGLAIAALVHSEFGLLAAALAMAVGVAFTTPAFFAAIFSRVPASERGSASGTASMFLDLAFAGGPLVVGAVAGVAGIPAGFGAAALVALSGAAGSAFFFLPRYRPVEATSD